ncbi:Retinol dehydrogenase 14 [Blattella germanica]|nr:Retinol dehydrogenase 14 [Blattella germanica]
MFWIVVSVITVTLIGLKLYTRITLGICTSTRRLDGKTVIVTGANTGIGKETAHDLAQRGARVILACRDLKRAQEACDGIIAATGNKNVVVRELDLSSFASVRKFANEIIKTEPQIDVLVNNAGAGGLGNKKSRDGLLIDKLKKSAPSRIVMVSSFAHKFANFDLDNLNAEKSFNDVQVYNISVTINSLHPGVVITDIFRRIPKFILPTVLFFLRIFAKNARDGAQTSIYLAVSEEVEGVTGKYFADCKVATVSSKAKDDGLAKKLWEKSEALVGLKPEERHF